MVDLLLQHNFGLNLVFEPDVVFYNLLLQGSGPSHRVEHRKSHMGSVVETAVRVLRLNLIRSEVSHIEFLPHRRIRSFGIMCIIYIYIYMRQLGHRGFSPQRP